MVDDEGTLWNQKHNTEDTGPCQPCAWVMTRECIPHKKVENEGEQCSFTSKTAVSKEGLHVNVLSTF